MGCLSRFRIVALTYTNGHSGGRGADLERGYKGISAMLYAAQYQANETLPNGLRIAPRNPIVTSQPQFEAKQALNHSSIGSFARSTT